MCLADRSMSLDKLNMTNGGCGSGCPTLRDWKAGVPVCGLSGDEIVVWLIELDAGLESQAEIDETEPGRELEVLDEEERVRAARFVRARDRRRFARCRSALREILGGLIYERPEALRFRAVARGKPELDFPNAHGGEPPVRFNVSHSADLAVIAVCRGRELGIDLEQVRAIGEAERIVESFFSADELAEFGRIGPEKKAMAFLRGWTRKEAILKGLGVGIAGLADRHQTGFGTGEVTAEFSPAAPNSRVGAWQLWEASPRSGFVATVACRVDTADGYDSATGRSIS
jgi:4'-phosphopantetheinyl transferase